MQQVTVLEAYVLGAGKVIVLEPTNKTAALWMFHHRCLGRSSKLGVENLFGRKARDGMHIIVLYDDLAQFYKSDQGRITLQNFCDVCRGGFE